MQGYLLRAQLMSTRLKVTAYKWECYNVPVLSGEFKTHMKLILKCFIVEAVKMDATIYMGLLFNITRVNNVISLLKRIDINTKIEINLKCQLAFHPGSRPYVCGVLLYLAGRPTAYVRRGLVLNCCYCILH